MAQATTAPETGAFTLEQKLRELKKPVPDNLIKQREGWRDRNGNSHMVDYIEWHTAADLLDDIAPTWTHSVKSLTIVGEMAVCICAITVEGITREGVGTGAADTELGIKKAEHDALKRAAVKFGVGRELYKKESDIIERDGSPQEQEGPFPRNPIARSLSDLVTAKQLGMIRALARENGVDPDEECRSLMDCKSDELSKRAASALIQHFQDMEKARGAGVDARRY